ncbi:hypothetical protein F4604DRAFT_1957028 [Suillus subluteus]|nr:hypothetical protein F4604DRAFT_1957028 [Suillus subluteus]
MSVANLMANFWVDGGFPVAQIPSLPQSHFPVGASASSCNVKRKRSSPQTTIISTANPISWKVHDECAGKRFPGTGERHREPWDFYGTFCRCQKARDIKLLKSLASDYFEFDLSYMAFDVHIANPDAPSYGALTFSDTFNGGLELPLVALSGEDAGHPTPDSSHPSPLPSFDVDVLAKVVTTTESNSSEAHLNFALAKVVTSTESKSVSWTDTTSAGSKPADEVFSIRTRLEDSLMDSSSEVPLKFALAKVVTITESKSVSWAVPVQVQNLPTRFFLSEYALKIH